jgi:ankyrin repeat protein
LSDHKFDIDIKDHQGHNCLDMTIQEGNLDTIKLLTDRGAQTTMNINGLPDNVKSIIQGKTPEEHRAMTDPKAVKDMLELVSGLRSSKL